MEPHELIDRKCVGHFLISSDLLDRAPAVVAKILEGLIVVHCEHLFANQAFHYVAYGAPFKPALDEIVFYKPIIRQLGPNKYHIEWERRESKFDSVTMKHDLPEHD